MGEMDTAGRTLVFDPTPLSRLISCAAVFGSAALFTAAHPLLVELVVELGGAESGPES